MVTSRRNGSSNRQMDARKMFLIFFGCLMVLYMLFLSSFQPHFKGDAPQQNLQQEKTDVSQDKVKEERKWEMNPDRKYVWLDIEIDGVEAGRVTAELFADIVPKTAENFRVLVTGERGDDLSYKNSVCHRIIKGFIVQCGDFETGKGYGGRSIYGRHFDDEPAGLALKHSKRYILQMANSGPNTNGSQFCFMLGPAPHLNTHHVVFGEVVDGFSVVDKMEAAGKQSDGDKMQHVVKILNGGEITE